jgi:hypothetical protein
MKPYIGVKRVRAMPMTRGEYNAHQRWKLPPNENGGDPGYLVEYVEGGQPNHPGHEGYISWSPQAVFERAYRATDGLTFGFAIEAMRAGLKLAREGWNGKGMFVFYVPPGRNQPTTMAAREFFGGGMVPYREYIAMKTVDGEVVPWLASQTDMLAEDWGVVE